MNGIAHLSPPAGQVWSIARTVWAHRLKQIARQFAIFWAAHWGPCAAQAWLKRGTSVAHALHVVPERNPGIDLNQRSAH
jgi:hypothetical protein